eukprot:12299386-Ditylum_brightwellii.AAC.1
MFWSKEKKHNLTILWIDYNKVCNLVPYSWTVEVLKTYKTEPTLIQLIEKFIPLWHTWLNPHTEGNTITTKELSITCGIFQDNTLSPLIFCIALFLLYRKLHQGNTEFCT